MAHSNTIFSQILKFIPRHELSLWQIAIKQGGLFVLQPDGRSL